MELENTPASRPESLRPTLEQMKSAATYRNKNTGTLFQLSQPNDDYSESAWWLNESEPKWQISNYSNWEVKLSKDFEEIK